MAERRDMWNECYEGEFARDLSPEAFRFKHCSLCRQSACTNSVAGKTKWQGRIETQEEILLNNPIFADPNDPRFQDVRELDFPNLLKKAMKLEISAKRGDWEPVTADDAMGLATELSRPTGFEPEPEPNIIITKQELVRGSVGKQYMVTIGTYQGDQVWDCSCPAFEFDRVDANGMCPHIRLVLGVPDPEKEKKKAPKERPLPPPPTRKSPDGRESRPSPEKYQQALEQNRIPKALNTQFPSDGIMIDGSAPPATEPVDPWAPPPKPKGTVIAVGGKVVLGGGKPEGDE